jgi:drug/metabolite transporter (DMT)-like permease
MNPGNKPPALAAGVMCAVGAGLVWGLVFVAPLMLADYPAAALSIGRYLAFGLIALPLAVLQRRELARLARADWLEARRLALVGNLMYYASLAAAIQLAGGALPTLIIGTLPLVISVVSNLGTRELPWRSLGWALALIATGLLCVHGREWPVASEALSNSTSAASTDPVLGLLLALLALACWTWYPIRNARWLRHRGVVSASAWVTAALLSLAWLHGDQTVHANRYDWPLGPRPADFLAAMFAMGLLASWLGTWLWNRAAERLPTALSGQLIVFETIAALVYVFVLRGQAPDAITLLGIALLLIGVLAGIRAVVSR